MSTAYKDISAALSNHLNTISPKPAIAWENYPYTPVDDTLYVRETLLPGDVTAAAVGSASQDHTIGIYQVDVFSPLNRGKADAVAQADAIADHFKRGTILTYNGVNVRMQNVSRGTGQMDGGKYWQIPVLITFEVYTNAR